MSEDANLDPVWTVTRGGGPDSLDVPTDGTLVTFNPPPFTALGIPLGGFFVDLSAGCLAETPHDAATSEEFVTAQTLHLKVPPGGPSDAWPPGFTVGNIGLAEIPEVYPSDGYAIIASLA
jgi:hypothetical protein